MKLRRSSVHGALPVGHLRTSFCRDIEFTQKIDLFHVLSKFHGSIFEEDVFRMSTKMARVNVYELSLESRPVTVLRNLSNLLLYS